MEEIAPTTIEWVEANQELIEKLEDNLRLTEFQISCSNWKETKKLFTDYTKILYDYSDLEFTLKILKSYTFILGKLRIKSLGKEERIREAFEEHKSILKFMIENNLEEVKKVNKKHLLNSKKSTIQYFKERIK